ncbi:MAG: S8 family serine peptidase [Verrucomicrobiae bacterium]|nr:S8 family serine peptidase [Verrucomicrobiae bacterium]
MILCFSVGVMAAEPVLYKGHLVHPERVLVKLRSAPGGQLAAPTAQDLAALGEAPQASIALLPGWWILEETPQAKAAAGEAVDAKAAVRRLAARLEKLQRSGLFAWVEPDWLLTKCATPTDAAFTDGRLWGLRNTGQSGGTVGVDVGAVAAWDVTVGSTNVIVAVVDTGIRYTHQDLQANMWRNPGEVPGNGVDDDRDGYVDNVYGINAITGSGDPMDDEGHGTHVAGTIGAVANNGQPVVGVAWRVRLMACKFLDANGSGKTSDAIKGLDFAVAKGARVINGSFGGGPYSQAFYEALVRARDRGVLFVAAAGNEANNNDTSPVYPASYAVDNVIAVAAIDRTGALADFSNYGRTSVDLAAPGVAIFSCYNGSDTDTKSLNGTSMAAPHVAGVAALVWSAQPAMTVSEMRQRLLGTTVAMGSLLNRTVTGGRVNAAQALQGIATNAVQWVVSPPEGSTVVAGSSTRFTVALLAASPVTNATVTAQPAGQSAVVLAYNAAEDRYAGLLAVPSFATTWEVTFSLNLPGRLSTNWVGSYTVITPPANDNFAKGTVLASGTNLWVSGNNRQASRESGEPLHAGNGGGASVWWRWTAPQSGRYEVHTTGSNFDTLLAVYTGNAVNALTSVASNDDDPAGGVSSRVQFQATGGTVYQIAVDGYNGASGDIQLNLAVVPVTPPPANDAFAQSITLTGALATVTGHNRLATKEAGEPNHGSNRGGASVWWRWVAPASGTVSLTTAGSDFDTLLAVYTGGSVSSLNLVAGNDDDPNGGVQSRVSFTAAAGTVYAIAVDGYNGAQGNIQLNLNQAQGPARPLNDDFAAASVLSGTNVTVSGVNRGATRESGEPQHAGNAGGRSVWWRWVAPARGAIQVHTRGSNFDTLLAVYTGSSLGSLTAVAANDDDPEGGTQSYVTLNVVTGITYYIAVDGYQGWLGDVAAGDIQLQLQYLGQRPPNDDFAQRVPLTGAVVTATGTSVGATTESGEPQHNGLPANRSVWWSWRPGRDGYVRITTEGSSFDTVLAVYTGNTLGTLRLVQGNDDGLTAMPPTPYWSEVYFWARADTTYQIAVDGFGASSGAMVLNIAQQLTSSNLYFTDFNASNGYRAGMPLNGQNGWTMQGASPASQILSAGSGGEQMAYIGYSPTYSTTYSRHYVWRPVSYLPATNQVVRFSTRMRLVDSTNGRYDHFAWAVFNRSGDFLFEVRFHNDESPVGIYYRLNDGLPPESTDVTMGNDVEYEFSLLMDFNRNVWEASLDGMTLVEGVPINNGNNPVLLNLGEIDAVWYWSSPPNGGDNYLLFDDYRIEILTVGRPPVILSAPASVAVTEGATVNLQVQAGGTAPLFYRWLRDGEAVAGATNAVLLLANINVNQAGNYQVLVSNQFGTVLSAPAVVQVNRPLVRPSNDQFSQRAQLTGLSNVVTASNLGATQEFGEPLHAGNAGGASVWWTWRAPVTGRFTVSTVGSDFDTVLAVYTGTALEQLTLVAANDDAQAQQRGSWLTFTAQSNAIYQIAVDGFNGAYGNIRLSLKPDATPRWLAPARSGGLVFEFTGEQGLRFTLQTSTNLRDWLTVTNYVNLQGTVRHVEPPSQPRRFYRVVQE